MRRLSGYYYAVICRGLGIRMGPKQHMAARYLEDRGSRFLIDYGYQNAISMAREEWHKQSRPNPTLRAVGGR